MSAIGIELKSKAMWGSFCYHGPSRTLFDAGPGMVQYMESRVYAFSQVILSHQHVDHVADLFPLIGLRAKTRGDREKPLTVYFPADNHTIPAFAEFIRKVHPKLPYNLDFVPLTAGDRIDLPGGSRIETFPLYHQPAASTLGYRIVENTKALRPELIDRIKAELLSNSAIGEMIRAMKERGEETHVTRTYVPFVYALDHYRLDPADLRGAAIAIMDSTFLDETNRVDPTHSTAQECVDRAAAGGVKHVVLAHLSVRYDLRDPAEILAKLSIPAGLQVTLCPIDRVLTL